MQMKRFKLGDRIVLRDSVTTTRLHGAVGKVVRVYRGETYCGVVLDNPQLQGSKQPWHFLEEDMDYAPSWNAFARRFRETLELKQQ